jgi:hypothetical protein
LTPRQIKQAVRSLERKGLIVKKRDALGNVMTRPGEDGKPEVVWVAKQKVQRARCLSRSLDALPPQRMTATAPASGA